MKALRRTWQRLLGSLGAGRNDDDLACDNAPAVECWRRDANRC